MKYTEEERLDIGRQIYDGLLSCSEAAVKFSINPYTARDYMRFYRDLNNLPDKDGNVSLSFARKNDAKDLEFYLSLSKEQLIDELIKAKVNEARAKKRISCERGWSKKGIRFFKQQEYQIVLELSALFPIKKICKVMCLNRSGFYA